MPKKTSETGNRGGEDISYSPINETQIEEAKKAGIIATQSDKKSPTRQVQHGKSIGRRAFNWSLGAGAVGALYRGCIYEPEHPPIEISEEHWNFKEDEFKKGEFGLVGGVNTQVLQGNSGYVLRLNLYVNEGGVAKLLVADIETANRDLETVTALANNNGAFKVHRDRGVFAVSGEVKRGDNNVTKFEVSGAKDSGGHPAYVLRNVILGPNGEELRGWRSESQLRSSKIRRVD